jgi:hypothetical protein
MRELIGDKTERKIFMFLVSILFSVLAWQIVDKFIVTVSYFQSLFIEFFFVILLILYTFISRKVNSAYRD